jgi:hypothetical protein
MNTISKTLLLSLAHNFFFFLAGANDKVKFWVLYRENPPRECNEMSKRLTLEGQGGPDIYFYPPLAENASLLLLI